MKQFILGLLLTFFFAPSSLGCIWKNSQNPYWQNNEIPVCFIKPQGEFSFEMKRARYTILRAFKNQFNKRTDFNFTGFGFCPNISKDKPTEAIRIALTYGMGGGLASGVGPASAKDSPNLSIDYIGIDVSTQKPIFSATTTVNVTLHETMHLLGFLHDTKRTNKRRLASIQHHNPILVDDFDKDSVLVNPNATVLSEGDIKCLNLVAQRKIAGVDKNQDPSNQIEEVTLDLGDPKAGGQSDLEAELETSGDLEK